MYVLNVCVMSVYVECIGPMVCYSGKISHSALIHRYWNCASWCIGVYHYFLLL